MPELVSMAGGLNLFGEAGKHSPWMTWDELVTKDPDIIFVSPCGFDIPRTLEEMNLLSDKNEWNNLNAVRGGKVFVADGNQYFNRPGPRLAEALENHRLRFRETEVTRGDRILDNDDGLALVLLRRKFEALPEVIRLWRVLLHF